MKIRMYKNCAGPDGVLFAGHIYDVPEDKAQTLIISGAAIYCDVAEIEVIEPPEQAVIPKPQKKKGKAKRK